MILAIIYLYIMTYGMLKNKIDRLVNDRTYAGKRYFDLFMMFLVINSVVLLIFEILLGVFRKNVFELSLVFGFIAIVGVASATFVYVLERGVPEGNFQSLGDAMWWSFVTITTVGYGDKVPVTDMGRIVAVFLMLCAIASIALPSGILASAMTQKFTSMKEERLSMRKFKNHIVVCGWNNSAEQLRMCLRNTPRGKRWILWL